jgi:hypothetical protein
MVTVIRGLFGKLTCAEFGIRDSSAKGEPPELKLPCKRSILGQTEIIGKDLLHKYISFVDLECKSICTPRYDMRVAVVFGIFQKIKQQLGEHRRRGESEVLLLGGGGT